MGNCCERCLGRLDKRRYLRTRYNVERDISIEFENLMDEESQDREMPSSQDWREMNAQEDVEQLIQISRALVHQEEELRREEEAYYESKKKALKAAKAASSKPGRRRTDFPAAGLSGAGKIATAATMATAATNSPAGVARKDANTWLDGEDSDWEMAGGEEDLGVFLECVRARSLAARTRAADAHDVTSETSSRDDRSKTEASSIDLEWEHEAGMQSAPREQLQQYAAESSRIAELAIKPIYLQRPPDPGVGGDQAPLRGDGGGEDEFEWDNDFVTSPTEEESRTLLVKGQNVGGEAER